MTFSETASQEIANKLDVLIRLSALTICEGKPRRDQFVLLSNAGIHPAEIANILGTEASTVRGELSRVRTGKRKLSGTKNR